MYGTSNNTEPIRRPIAGRINQTTHHTPRHTRRDRVAAAARVVAQGV
jgi:hypothetical protein